MAAELKDKGNAAFSSGDYEGAIKFFSEAIEIDPTNHVFFSNRSAAQASLKNYDAALEDAKKVVEIKSDWPKGYSRLGAAHFGLGQLEEAKEQYKKGLELDPNNSLLQQGLKDVEAATNKPMNPFSSPDFFGKLLSNPKTKAFLGQPDFMSMITDLQKSPQNMSKYVGDPKFMAVLEVGLGVGLATSNPEDVKENTNGGPSTDNAGVEEVKESKAGKPEAASPNDDDDSMEEDTADSDSRKRQVDAAKEKDAGNVAYKKKKFDEAIAHYTKALELWDKDISFLTNRAAVYLEIDELDECIKSCDQAIETGREIHADYKLIARALTRKGKALVKKGEVEEAIKIFNKSLTEHRNADTLKALNDAERSLKDAKEQAYIDVEKSVVEKEAGNEAFKAMDYPKAVKHYTEALKRGPAAVNEEAYKLYSNRAACYTKLVAMNEALKDAEKCIELKPDFPKGYSRKGHVQEVTKEHEKALKTYQEGLEHCPDNQELKDGLRRCQNEMLRYQRGDVSEEELKERRAKAMNDPEVQQILTDPVMSQVLRDFEQDPSGAQKHLKNPQIMSKLNKLISSGIIQMK
ncbi:hypothetical protein BSKO_06067 [Bryopsis sp. KO-2023]|nr:hypothetical protein BSKO_06067 [Bryopsis sp. KO-2023]